MTDQIVQAAGALPWRRRKGKLEVAMVHRPHYDDWSWPKGKLDPEELLPETAAREVQEEAALRVHLGRPLPTSEYTMPKGGRKRVHYWAARVEKELGGLEHEVDEIVWATPKKAAQRLTYAHDAEQLEALIAHEARGHLDTWSLVILRHSLALPRREWHGPDPERPLVPEGFDRSTVLAGSLAAFGVDRIVSSPSARCADTVAPFAAEQGLRPRFKAGLSEEGFAEKPKKAAKHVLKAAARGRGTVLCSHGPVLGSMLRTLADRAASDAAAEAELLHLAENGMAKGGFVVAHMIGRGETAQVVTAEIW